MGGNDHNSNGFTTANNILNIFNISNILYKIYSLQYLRRGDDGDIIKCTDCGGT